MTPELRRTFGVLAREALGDALRRRLVLVIGVASLLSLQLVNSCTSCGTANITHNGQPVTMPEMAGIAALAVAIACTLWTLILAGALASDHLDEPLVDGSAALVLARPVGRATFALARLSGVLAIALVSGAVLLGGAGILLHARQGLPLAPLLGAFAATAAGAATVAAFAMAASLSAPRIATLLGVLMSVGAVAAVNVAGLFDARFGGIATLLDGYGPPFVSSVAFALSDWIAPTLVRGNAVAFALRHLVWLTASVALLIHTFRRIEIE